MAREGVERRLTTILSADVVGYSRLMAADEAGTFAQLKTHRRELIEPKTTEHHGRVVKLMGDGTLMEFASVVDAVNFAVDVQQAMMKRNASVPEDLQIKYRIGINLGEIIVDGEDIYGDGVNIAARLEGLAEPCGIFISGKVYEEVRNKLSTAFEDLGEQEVKNIPEPVRVWRWLAGDRAAPAGQLGATEPLPFPDKPSIAVLAFTNMSGDPEQEYFADGITEDIITELSRFSSLFVIARHSSFAYKGQSINVATVGQELGVKYVVEGSVRKAGNRVRITAQLVEAESGNHVWAERYDRDLDDIFELQDEVTQVIVGIIPGRMEAAEAQKAERKVPDNMTAYDRFLRGLQEFNLSHVMGAQKSREACKRAKQHFQEAIELEPGYARAHTYIALTEFCEFFYNYAGKDSLQHALAIVQTAIVLDQHDTFAPAVHGLILVSLGRVDEGVSELEQALELNRYNAELLHWAGFVLSFSGNSADGITYVTEAIRLDPFNKGYHTALGFAFYLNGQFEEAVEAFRKVVRAEWTWAQACLAAAYGQVGRVEEAKFHAGQFADNVAKELRERGEPVSDNALVLYEQAWRDYLPSSNWLDAILDGLRKASL